MAVTHKINSKSIQKWREFSDEYISLYEAASYERTPPNLYHFDSESKGLKQFIMDEISQNSINTWPIDIYKFRDGFVSDLCFIYNNKGDVFEPSSFDQSFGSMPTHINTDTPVPIVTGAAAFIFKSGKCNYGHFIIEMLPKLHLLASATNDVITLLLPTVPPEIENILHEVVAKMYSQRFRFQRMTSPIMQVSELLYPGPVCEHNNRKSHAVLDFSNKLLKSFNTNTSFGNKLYISRSKSSKRKLKNAQEIEDHFTALGYNIIYPELMSFENQVSAFNNAALIAGPIGAGMSNIVYCNPDAQVIILDTGLYDFFFYDLAALKGIETTWIFDNLRIKDNNSLVDETSFDVNHLYHLK